MKKEKDPASQERLIELRKKLGELNDALSSLKGQWTTERDIIENIRQIKASIDEAHMEEQRAERIGDLSKVAEIRYGKMIQFQKDLEVANGKLQQMQEKNQMLKEEVGAEDVAAVVAKWTGIPVDRLLEGEKDKLVHAESTLAREWLVRKTLSRRLPMRCAVPELACRTQSTPGLIYLSWPDRSR